MRVTSFLLLVVFFLGVPVLLLNTVLMPQLDQLRYTYEHADEIANRVVSQ